ncbi:phage tail protein [Marinomonas transparens]|uniref:Phage tail protein n=1 Tax=Marinomonas transparens TaxID=2795388 RepID=A0A934JT84_9GAMM|nr:phage tail protein [Marinomonas transparens]MBJ7536945.1 phage tail protein [Marinomonas transparens]
MAERYSLPIWEKKGPNNISLKSAFGSWWDKAEEWIKTPLNQMNAETCSVALLKYHAYQKDVTRFSDEPDDLFRKRVKYAEQNAMDAGSKAGFIQIFERLGIGYLEMLEREDAENWDVITLRLSDSQIASNIDLLSYIIQQYGRTCRRYELTVLTPLEMTVGVFEVGHAWSLDVAKQVIEPWEAQSTVQHTAIGHSWTLDVAEA